MKYITLHELTSTIRNNIFKIPHDVDFVIGIPRSGVIVGSIISEFLNVPLIDIDSYCNGSKPTGGNRLSIANKSKSNKVLVVDDTTYSGNSMSQAKEKLKNDNHEFIYGVAYLEAFDGLNAIDFYLENLIPFTKQFPNILYEWNIFHHYPAIMLRTIYDMDGVLCLDPPDERNTEEYEKYIQNAIPLYVPSVPIGKILTYRLIKYKEQTSKWLEDNGIQCNILGMFNAQSYKERQDMNISPEIMKGSFYKDDIESILFIESNDHQAQEIHKISGKPVLSIEKNILYGGE